MALSQAQLRENMLKLQQANEPTPLSITQPQQFEFENYQAPEPQARGDIDWGAMGSGALDLLTANMAASAGRAIGGQVYDIFNNPEKAKQDASDSMEALTYMLQDASMEPFMLQRDKLALPMRDPRRDAVQPVVADPTGVIAGMLPRVAPKVGKAALGHGLKKYDELVQSNVMPAYKLNMSAKDNGITVPGVHYSRKKGLTELDPAFHGEGAAGAETRYTSQLGPEDQPVMFYAGNVAPESQVSTLAKSKYAANLTDVYPATDPEGYMKTARANNTSPKDAQVNPGQLDPVGMMRDFNASLRQGGYKGYIGNVGADKKAVTMLGKVPVTEFPGSMPMQGVQKLPGKTPEHLGTPRTNTKYQQEMDQLYKDNPDALFSPVPDNTPAIKQANAQNRADKWSQLEDAQTRAGKARQKSGRYIGGSEDMTSPQKKNAVANKYAQRVQDSIDAGIPPGYFYEEGREILKQLTPNTEAHRKVAEIIGPTSTQVGPKSNLDYTIRALEQDNAGTQVSVGLYPNSLRPKVEAAIAGEDPWKGYKVERYRNLLGPDTPNDELTQLMPPNDQWEGRGTGWPTNKVPASTPQVAFSDHIRDKAAAKINKKRKAQGLPELTLPEVQELHWAAIRAQTEGRPLQLNPGDTIQGSVPGQTYQHSWEAAPGPDAGHKLTNMDVQEYSDEMLNVIRDDQGKDRLVSAMGGGGELQLPIMQGTGVYKGVTSPGMQSRSMVAQTKTHGMDAASQKRVDTTEHIRQVMLAQEARAGHSLIPETVKKNTDTFDVITGGVPTEAQTKQIGDLVDSKLGKGQVDVVFSEDGYRLLNTGSLSNHEVGRELAAIQPNLEKITGKADIKAYRRGGTFGKDDWPKGGVTKGLMDAIDDPAFPGMARQADSPAMRKIAGDVAGLYRQLEAAGKLAPNQKLTNVLEAWQSGGLDAVRSMVQKGLAPAGVLAILASQMQEGEQQPMPGARSGSI